VPSTETVSFDDFFKRFPNEEAARKFFEGKRWRGDRFCPHCGSVSTVETKDHKPMAFRCRDCRQHFSVRTGTILAESRLPLHKWLMAIYMMTTIRKGIPSIQVARDLCITQKSAWFLCERIRETWLAKSSDYDADMGLGVEVDDSFVCGKETNKPTNQKLKSASGAVAKVINRGVQACSGEVPATLLSCADNDSSHSFLAANVQTGWDVCTGKHADYRGIQGCTQITVSHSAGEYANSVGDTNGIGSFWALLKRGYNGICHYISMKHLNRYFRDFATRQNAPSLSTLRFKVVSSNNIIYSCFTHKELINA